MKTMILLIGICMALLSACGNDEEAHDHSAHGTGAAAHEEHGPNGGELVELGDHVAHLEVVHDDEAGTITLYVLDADLKTIKLDKEPVLNIHTDAGPKQVVGTALGNSDWVFQDSALKSEPKGGRLRVVLGGVTYSPELPHDHDDH